ncbi:YigZ family protein [Herbidospora sp. NBRC 101105]|uniref:IMPACT family protein n=1 Tax=Herbidospora sp. NBRC 101105 TaxID=3032195 RepID=UPI0024A34AB1|nr:YigZ family protein [Herbidospora sp. NBRC 101105]GLX93645.1 YigZ family protein [Herbidospora sp. NBRC 101105]
MPYKTLDDVVEHETEVRRSRFVCAVAPAPSEEAAREFISARRALYADATHNCTAYVIGAGARRSDDDGEPGGTAGTPMLDVLLRRGYADVVTVVTRFFGGVLLGAGGLVRAYGGAVGETLDRVRPVTMVEARLVTVSIDHAHAGRLENDLRGRYDVRGVTYGSGVAFDVAVADPAGFEEWLATATAGRATASAGDLLFVRAEDA